MPSLSKPTHVVKRDGRRVPYDRQRIVDAVAKCLRSTDAPVEQADDVAAAVEVTLVGDEVRVEHVQDVVELVLMRRGLHAEARHYIVYREEHARLRRDRDVDPEVRAIFDQSTRALGDDPLRAFQFFDKYSRFDHALGRREAWLETVDRSVSYLRELVVGRFSAASLADLAPTLASRTDDGIWGALHRLIADQQAMPSMRLLAMAGPAARRQNAAIYNCFAGVETFLTPSGPVRFVDHVGRGVRVRCADGAWRNGRVEAFGEQDICRVVLGHWTGGKATQGKHEVLVTANHRWILLDGNETTSLAVGDKLAPSVVDDEDALPTEAIRHGFVFGDGTINRQKARVYGQVRLCGKKARLLSTLFADYPHSFPPSCGGDPVVYLGAEGVAHKDLPAPAQITPGYVAGFIVGLAKADGTLSTSGNFAIATEREDVEAWLRAYAPLAGYKILSVRVDDRPTNFGDRSAPLRIVLLGIGPAAVLRVEAIERVGLVPVYCVVEPVTRTFTLGCGQVTGNCTYLPLVDLRAFQEVLLLSMAGCGVGFSVEGQYVYELPFVRRQRVGPKLRHVVEDSTEGWGDALLVGLEAWFAGSDVDFDFAQVRAAGAVLRTKGGRASGPDPLRTLLATAREIVLRRQGAMLRPIDAHDITCAIGLGAVSGGMRRTAMISLFDHDDAEMLAAKSGAFPDIRWNANNSAVWPTAITQQQVMQQMLSMAQARRGEPGIFNREAALRLRPARRAALDPGHDWGPGSWWEPCRYCGVAPGGVEPGEPCPARRPVYGTNPCGEIILRPFEMCNLSIAIARSGDSYADLAAKVEAATLLGTIQSLATHFPGLRPDWARNCEEERLLGVDLTAHMDCAAARDPEVLRRLRGVAVAVNAAAARALGINPSAAITCDKPGGNSSQFLGIASGIHARYAHFYKRRARVSAHSPTYQVLRDAAVPMTPENGQRPDDADTWVVTFYVASPDGAIVRHDLDAVAQCEAWLRAKLDWTEHNPSCTVYYRPDELLGLTAWVWEHRDTIGGLSFFPVEDAAYEQPPYEEITQEAYEEGIRTFPKIDWAKLVRYESSDTTTAAQEVACTAGACEWEPPARGSK